MLLPELTMHIDHRKEFLKLTFPALARGRSESQGLTLTLTSTLKLFTAANLHYLPDW